MSLASPAPSALPQLTPDRARDAGVEGTVTSGSAAATPAEGPVAAASRATVGSIATSAPEGIQPLQLSAPQAGDGSLRAPPGWSEQLPGRPPARKTNSGHPLALPEELKCDQNDEFMLGVGYVICFLTLVEGALVVVSAFDIHFFGLLIVREGTYGHWSGLGTRNPFGTLLEVLIKAQGIGDLIIGCVGIFGLWLCTNMLLPLTFEDFIPSHSFVATSSITALLAWRALNAVMAAPYAGLILAFQNPDLPTVPGYCGAFIYIVVNVLLVCVLVFVLRSAAKQSRLLQLELAMEFAERKKVREQQTAAAPSGGLRQPGDCTPLLQTAPCSEEPVLFGFAPTLLTTMVYFLLICGSSSVIALQLLWNKEMAVGGWAVLAWVQYDHATYELELVVYIVSCVCSLVGFFSAVSYATARVVERDIADSAFDRATTDEEDEQLDRAQQTQRISGHVLLAVFLVSLLRVACFVPVTGMALFQQNICSTQASMDMKIGVERGKMPSAAPVRCTSSEVGVLVSVIIFALVDLYALWGVYAFWSYHHDRQQELASRGGGISKKLPTSYGAASANPWAALDISSSTISVPPPSYRQLAP